MCCVTDARPPQGFPALRVVVFGAPPVARHPAVMATLRLSPRENTAGLCSYPLWASCCFIYGPSTSLPIPINPRFVPFSLLLQSKNAMTGFSSSALLLCTISPFSSYYAESALICGAQSDRRRFVRARGRRHCLSATPEWMLNEARTLSDFIVPHHVILRTH